MIEQGKDPDGRGGAKELGGGEENRMVVRIYYMKKIFLIKEG